jgi:DNA-binding response OmpR family regulator
LKEHFQNGTDYILPVPFKPTFLVLIIKKFCGLIPKDFQQEIRYHKLILLPKQNILKYKEIKIELTKNEKHLLELILETDTPISSNDIYKYICSKQKINRKQVYTIISRLNRKFKTYTGLILLKNKYGVGYYITI